MFKFIFILLLSSMVFGDSVVLSPNMSMPVPVVGSSPGPDWANDINASLSIVDSHNHSSGQGVQINPDGLNISSDLTFQDNNITNPRSVRFFAQSSPLSSSADLGALYESGVDLYYNDGAGNHIRITQGGNVTGATGTITGLPSGTASASYAAGTFTFQSATSTPATMAVGPLVIGNQVASSKTVTLSPNNSAGSNYSLLFPTGLPASLNYMTLDSSGNISYNTSGFTGTGGVVLSTSPVITTPTIQGGTLLLDNGSAASPSLAFTNSAATGLYRSGANILGFTNGGVNSGLLDASFQWTLGSSGSAPASVHSLYGGLNLENTHGFFAGHNSYIGATNARNLDRYDSTQSGVALGFDSSATASNNIFNVFTNAPGDSITTTATAALSIASNGNTTIGKSGGTTTHIANGNLSVTGSITAGTIAAGTTVTAPSGIVFPSATMVDFNEGTWTPSYANFAGVITNVTGSTGRFVRTGNTVSCTIIISITWSGTGIGSFTNSLPIAPTNNFSSVNQLAGIAMGGVPDSYGSIIANTPGSKLASTEMRQTISSGTESLSVLTFSYIIND